MQQALLRAPVPSSPPSPKQDIICPEPWRSLNRGSGRAAPPPLPPCLPPLLASPSLLRN